MNPDFQQLPPEIRDMIASDDLMTKTEEIAEERQLRPEYYGALYRITANILKGRLHPNEYVANLESELDITHDDAVSLAQEVNTRIFNTIKDALKKVHLSERATPNTQEVPSQPGLQETKIAESTVDSSSTSNVPSAAQKGSETSVTPKPHIGNIFEEKLGGAFRVKSDEVKYTTTTKESDTAPLTPAPTPSTASSAPSVTPENTTNTPPAPAITPPQKTDDPYREKF